MPSLNSPVLFKISGCFVTNGFAALHNYRVVGSVLIDEHVIGTADISGLPPLVCQRLSRGFVFQIQITVLYVMGIDLPVMTAPWGSSFPTRLYALRPANVWGNYQSAINNSPAKYSICCYITEHFTFPQRIH